MWPLPQEIHSVGGALRITNTTDQPILIQKHQHFGQILATSTADQQVPYSHTCSPNKATSPIKPFSKSVSIDQSNSLPSDIRQRLAAINLKYDEVFNPRIAKYNGASGDIQAVVNMGPVLPPQRKGRLPQYNTNKMHDLQSKFDELEEAGVFAKPEQVDTTVEYLNPSFLVHKPNGGHRLVTAFGEVGQYSKPQPSLMPNVDSTLRAIGGWKYIIITDLLKSFYQIPLSPSSRKFCGVATPFKGIRVYTRCAMGMPGSETALEELMSRVLGNLIQEGIVVKIADDLYCGGNSPEEITSNWARVLDVLQANNLRLSASKTFICPQTANILGWVWCNGTLHASPHRICALSAVEPPNSVSSLRSFIGSYKFLSRVLKGYAELLNPLECLIAGKNSRDPITWSDEHLEAFRRAQQALKDNKTIHLPRPDDVLWIVTDGSVKVGGIGATMYLLRDQKLLLAGFFNARLRKHQVTWLPCEVEALCITSAVKHFSPYIIQSKQPAQILTDSKPCVQAYIKLCRGEFSASSRVTSFLSTVSRFQARVRHIAGQANLPSDYASRNPLKCIDQTCQICKFITAEEESVVLSITVADIIDGRAKMPFTSRATWLATQLDCPDLRRSHSHLTQGTRPSKKMTNIPDVKRYLRCVSIAPDVVLIVPENIPFQPARDRIVVSRGVLNGLLTAIHLRFDHPTQHQMKRLVTRFFFALDMDSAINVTVSACHHCTALKALPCSIEPQSTSPPPNVMGQTFAADVMRRYRQCVLVLRDTVSCYTKSIIIADEKRDTLRTALLTRCSELRYLGDAGITIRVDGAPGFTSLSNDTNFQKHGIKLEIGNVKNLNKNPVAEKAIQELGLELLHLIPEGGPISELNLALSTANMNARIRQHGLSARELWTQRDQLTGEQLPVDDRQVIIQQ